jgi:SSS family solute:Na+ symporter
MKFSALDYGIVAVYLVGVVVFGFISSRKQKTTKDYFLGGKEMKWWAVGLSIVASETSTLTFISIPGLAYRGNMQFLQLIIGYFIGRLLVTVIFIPAYYKGNIETAYDFLGKRFGLGLRKLTSSVFIITRVLASGVRLFATAIPVHIITGYDYPTSIAIIGLFTLIYTYLGGLKAVVTMDVVQMFIYVGGAIVSMVVVFQYLPNGIDDVIKYSTMGGINKFEVFSFNPFTNFSEFFATPYTLIGALLGGTFLTMASHGTDQLLVQRLLGCKTKKESQKALMLDASVIVIQFAFFLFLGLCLYAFYQGAPFKELVMKSTGLKLTSSDEIFPKFIVENLPTGIAGLVIAGVLASAMGTLSSAISSLASSTYLDLFHSSKKNKDMDPKREMFWSKIFTLLWGVVLTGGAMIFKDSKSPVVELGLSIASFTYGGLLGTFLLGVFFKRIKQTDAVIGFIAGILGMVFVIYYTKTAYTWYVVIGVIITIFVANIISLFTNKKIKPA